MSRGFDSPYPHHKSTSTLINQNKSHYRNVHLKIKTKTPLLMYNKEVIVVIKRYVLPEGFEPPTTVPKTGMISISLREHCVSSVFELNSEYFCFDESKHVALREHCYSCNITG